MSDIKKNLTIEPLPADYGKMPEGYDFSSKNKDYKEYKNDYMLRTDAVWEKEELKNWFRSYMKCFYFDKGANKYIFFEPEDMYTIVYEGSCFDEADSYIGYTPTGRTNSFQHGLGPKQRVGTSASTWYHMQDYYMLCALRFERWHQCDMQHYDLRAKKYDHNPDKSQAKSYPCYRSYYEATYACHDDMFDFLMELAYAKKASDLFHDDHSNWELSQPPTYYDTPDKASHKTMTY